MDKISYALGISMAGNLQNAGFKDLNIEELTRGISDIINGKKPDMTPEEAQQLLNQHFAGSGGQEEQGNRRRFLG